MSKCTDCGQITATTETISDANTITKIVFCTSCGKLVVIKHRVNYPPSTR